MATTTSTAIPAPDDTRWRAAEHREVSHYWTTRDLKPDHRGRTGTERVRLTIRHDRDLKQYSASLFLEEVRDGFVRYAVQIGGPRDGERPTYAPLDRTPVARYSARGFATYAADILERFLEGGTVRSDVADMMARLLEREVSASA